MKHIELSQLKLGGSIPLDAQVKDKLVELTSTLSSQLKEASESLAASTGDGVPVVTILEGLSGLISAITAITPNKADDVGAAMVRALVRALNR